MYQNLKDFIRRNHAETYDVISVTDENGRPATHMSWEELELWHDGELEVVSVDETDNDEEPHVLEIRLARPSNAKGWVAREIEKYLDKTA